MPRFSNKKVLITGGNRGIGAAITRLFAAEGAEVLFTYHHGQDTAERLLSELSQAGLNVKTVQLDLAAPGAGAQLIESGYQLLGDIDILVNNAGIASRQSFLDLDEEEVNRLMQINFLAPFSIMQQFAQRIIHSQQSGDTSNPSARDYCMVNITSISRQVITPGLAHYEASKAALSQMTKAIAMELAPYAIRVNEVAPGLIPTDINRQQWESNSPLWQKRVAGIPLQRAGTPVDIANAVLFLAENSWITGSTITVDGGRSCNWYGAETWLTDKQ